MELSLKNIGKIKEASIKINGVTVIAGENNTGKSTVGKTLYAVFNSLKDIDKKIKNEREQSVERVLISFLANMGHNTFAGKYRLCLEKAKIIVEQKEEIKNNSQLLIEQLIHFTDNIGHQQNLFFDTPDEDFSLLPTEDKIDITVKQILNILSLPDNEILGLYIDRALKVEFSGQIGNIYSNDKSQISLKIKNNSVDIDIENNLVTHVTNPISLLTETVYIDDPYILDSFEYDEFIPSRRNLVNVYHRKDLQLKLLNYKTDNNIVDELLTKKQINEVYEKLNSICEGQMVKNEDTIGYKINDSDVILNFINLSTGLKTFAIIKRLLEQGFIHENGTIILDEPEVHLHPEWQVIFAELIVLLQKDFGLHILLNTHSPYFLNAIETFAEKYKIKDKCNYYCIESEGIDSVVKDVTDNTELIYKKLARPLQELENIRFGNCDE